MTGSIIPRKANEYLLKFLGLLGLRHYVINVNFNGIRLKFALPLRIIHHVLRNLEHVLIDRDYFRLKHVIPGKGDIVVDAGAFIGLYSVLSGVLVSDNGRVLAFEPNRSIFPYLAMNIEINRLAHVYGFPVALCPWSGQGNLYIGENLAVSSLQREHVEYFSHVIGVSPIKCIRFSSFLRYIGCVDVLKLDIEGLEGDLLREGRPELWRVDRIIIEVHTDVVDPADIENILHEVGFSYIVTYTSDSMPDQLIIYGLRRMDYYKTRSRT